jgi:hypothetical protein
VLAEDFSRHPIGICKRLPHIERAAQIQYEIATDCISDIEAHGPHRLATARPGITNTAQPPTRDAGPKLNELVVHPGSDGGHGAKAESA